MKKNAEIRIVLMGIDANDLDMTLVSLARVCEVLSQAPERPMVMMSMAEVQPDGSVACQCPTCAPQPNAPKTNTCDRSKN